MKFGIGKMRNEGLNQHGRFTLTNKWRCSSDYGLGTRNLHGVEENGGKLLDEPLKRAPEVKELDKGDEEDDGWDDGEEEPSKVCGSRGAGQELSAIACETKKRFGEECNEVENVILKFNVSICQTVIMHREVLTPALVRRTKRARIY